MPNEMLKKRLDLPMYYFFFKGGGAIACGDVSPRCLIAIEDMGRQGEGG